MAVWFLLHFWDIFKVSCFLYIEPQVRVLDRRDEDSTLGLHPSAMETGEDDQKGSPIKATVISTYQFPAWQVAQRVAADVRSSYPPHKVYDDPTLQGILEIDVLNVPNFFVGIYFADHHFRLRYRERFDPISSSILFVSMHASPLLNL